MKEKFPRIEIMPLEESLRLTPEERIQQNNIMAHRWLEVESFIEKLFRGWTFIHSQHGNTH
jgi:hypothetical protein